MKFFPNLDPSYEGLSDTFLSASLTQDSRFANKLILSASKESSLQSNIEIYEKKKNDYTRLKKETDEKLEASKDQEITLKIVDLEKRRGNRKKFLSETDIRYAMSNARTNVDAAKFLGVGLVTYKKYAKMYIDRETGENLYEMHRKDSRKIKDKAYWREIYQERFGRGGERHKKDMILVLAGELPFYSDSMFRKRLFEENWKAKKCDCCGFEATRITDNKAPIVLIYKDGNKKNRKLENLEVLCFNCRFLLYGSSSDGSREDLRLFYEGTMAGQSKEEYLRESILKANKMMTNNNSEEDLQKKIKDLDDLNWDE